MPSLTHGTVSCSCSSSESTFQTIPIGCPGGSTEDRISIIKPFPPDTTVSICPDTLVVDCANQKVGINKVPNTNNVQLDVNGNISGNRGLSIFDTSPFITKTARGNNPSLVYASARNDDLSQQLLLDGFYTATGEIKDFILNTDSNDLIECTEPSSITFKRDINGMNINISFTYSAGGGAVTDDCTFTFYLKLSDNRVIFQRTNLTARNGISYFLSNAQSSKVDVTANTKVYLMVKKNDGILSMVDVNFWNIVVSVQEKQETSVMNIKCDTTQITSPNVGISGQLSVFNSGPNVGIYTNGWIQTNYGLYVTDASNKEVLVVDGKSNNVYFGAGRDNKILIVDTLTSQVGILTKDPQATLDINGTMLVNGTMKAGDLFFVDVPNNIIEISAPSAPAAMMGPMTLEMTTAAFPPKALYVDAANARVGIGVTDLPVRTLDVNGDAIVNGSLWADTYENLPVVPLNPTDILPIYLDQTNNRVGINTAVPDHPLHVTGGGYFTGFLASLGGMYPNGTATGMRCGTGSPEGVVSMPVGSIWLRSDGSSGTTMYAKESGTGNTGWLPIKSFTTSDISPITLDQTNNRVGINKTDPDYAIHAIGSGYVSGFFASTNGLYPNGLATGAAVLRAGTGTPEGSVSANVGSLFMRQDGAAGTTLYTKETGNGNTGWVALKSMSTTTTPIYWSNSFAGTSTSKDPLSSYTITTTGIYVIAVSVNAYPTNATTASGGQVVVRIKRGVEYLCTGESYIFGNPITKENFYISDVVELTQGNVITVACSLASNCSLSSGKFFGYML